MSALLLQEETYVALREREESRVKGGLSSSLTSAARSRAFEHLAELFRDLCGDDIEEIDTSPWFHVKHR